MAPGTFLGFFRCCALLVTPVVSLPCVVMMKPRLARLALHNMLVTDLFALREVASLTALLLDRCPVVPDALLPAAAKAVAYDESAARDGGDPDPVLTAAAQFIFEAVFKIMDVAGTGFLERGEQVNSFKEFYSDPCNRRES